MPRRRDTTVFLSGVVSGVALVWASALAAKRWLYPRPSRVVSSVLPTLRAQREVRASVGTRLAAGRLQAYFLQGGPRWQAKKPFIYWESLSLSVLFQVHGEVSSAFVALCVGRDRALQSLVVDLPSGERLLLKEAPNDRHNNSLLQRYQQLHTDD